MSAIQCYGSLSRKVIDKAVNKLIKRNNRMVGHSEFGIGVTKDYFICFIAKNVEESIRGISSFVSYDSYPDSIKTEKGNLLEVGSIGNVRFFYNPLWPDNAHKQASIIIQAWDHEHKLYDCEEIDFERHP